MKFEDAPLLSDVTYKKGIYTVGSKHFITKHNALIEVSKTKQKLKWDFNTAIFAQECQRPQMDVRLIDLYKQRALQLRDKYDYLILSYSGGADSDNVLQTFLRNNIKLDEVWTEWPLSLLDKAGYKPSQSLDKTNLPIEWFQNVEPTLKELEKTHPEITIHITDSFDYYNNVSGVEDFEDGGTFLQVPTVYTSLKRWRYMKEYITKLVEKGLNVGVIHGAEKCVPYLTRNNNNGNFNVGFLMNDRGLIMDKFLDDPYFYSNDTRMEAFYWSADFPSIVVQQAHLIWDYLKKNKDDTINRLEQRDKEYINWYTRRTNFDDIIKRICYPYWDFTKIQVEKSYFVFNHSFQVYASQFKNEKFFQSWESNYKSNLRRYDPSLCFVNGKDVGNDVVVCIKFHKIGEVSW